MPHIHDLIDFVIDAYIVYAGKILLIFHKKLKMWLPIGGHVELDEDTDQALLREIKEECGLDVEILASKLDRNDARHKHLYRPSYLNIHEIAGHHKHLALIYFAKAKSGKFLLNKD